MARFSHCSRLFVVFLLSSTVSVGFVRSACQSVNQCTSKLSNLMNNAQSWFYTLTYGQTSTDYLQSICASWNDFTSCATTNGCTFDELFQQLSTQTSGSSFSQQQYSTSINAMTYMCWNAHDYTQLCYSSQTAQQGLRRCEAIDQTMWNYPHIYYLLYSYDYPCIEYKDQVRCYYRALVTSCGAEVAKNMTAHKVYYHELYSDAFCLRDWKTWVTTSTIVGSCDSDQFFYCWNQLLQYGGESYVMTQFTEGQMLPSSLESYCSALNNVKTCVNASGCTFDHVYELLLTQLDINGRQYYQQEYNKTIVSMKYMCDHAQEYATNQPCYSSPDVQSGLSRCESIDQVKRNYPFYYFFYLYSTCTETAELVTCYYNTVSRTCNHTTAFLLASYKLDYLRIWQSSSCESYLDEMINSTRPVAIGDCNVDDFFYYSYPSIWSYAQSDYMSMFSHGEYPPSTVQSYCSSWNNFSTRINASGCSFDDIFELLSLQPGNTQYYYQHYNNSVRSMIYMCNRVQEYTTNYPCYSSTAIRNGLRRCDAITQAKMYYPYYLTYYKCSRESELLTCYFKTLLPSCNQTSALILSGYKLGYLQIWESSSCVSDLNDLINTSRSVYQCDDDAFFYCSSQWWIYIDSYRVSQIINAQLSPSTLQSHCSYWNSFTSCANASNCTFDDIYQLLSTQSGGNWQMYYQRIYNGTHLTLEYLCSHYQNYLSLVNCYETSARGCNGVLTLKQSYPYNNIYNDYCKKIFDRDVCAYNILLEACGYTTADIYLKFTQQYNNIWESSLPCHFDGAAVIAAHSSVADFCGAERYLWCLSQTSTLQWELYSSNHMFFTELLQASESWILLSDMCTEWSRVTNCTGCAFSEARFPTRSLNMEAYFGQEDWTYKEIELLTPQRLEGLCAVSSEDYTTFTSCFATHDFFSVFYSECRFEASATFDRFSCDFYRYWGRCLSLRVARTCSLAAAEFLATYLFNGLQQYVQHYYSCTLELSDLIPYCSATPCWSELSNATSNYMSLLQTGQLTTNDLTDLCSMTSSTAACVTDALGIRELCPPETVAYYLPLVDVVQPFVCDLSNQQNYMSVQQCYSAVADVQTLIDNFHHVDESCSGKHALLFNIYDAVYAPCGQEAATSVASFSSHLQTLSVLASSVASNCPSVLFPNIGAVPEFIGPVLTTSSGNGGCGDYKFTCRVNYANHVTDDGARFDVSLVADGQLLTTHTTTTSTTLEVDFTQNDLLGHYGKTISCATRSFWSHLPTIKSPLVHSVRSYFVGIKYWTEFWDNDRIEMFETTPYVPLYFQATVPITCPPCSLSFELSGHFGLSVSTCSFTFDCSMPPLTNHTLRIRALPTPGTNSRILRLNFKPLSANNSENPWDGYTIRDIAVLVRDEMVARFCSSDGDPHIRTFDNVRYSIYFTGDFVLWRSYGAAYVDVHVRHRKCFGGSRVSCNCAIAFRENNNVIGVYGCELGKPPVAIRYLTDPDTNGATIDISNDGTSYKLTMPSGRYVTASFGCRILDDYCLMHINVFALSSDVGNSQGLCGNNNGDPHDDIYFAYPDTYLEPLQFVKSHMLSSPDSLINGHVYYPRCIVVENPIPDQCQCGQTANTCAVISALTGSSTEAVVFGTYGTDSCLGRAKRRKRQTLGSSDRNVILPTDLVEEPHGDPPNETLHSDDPWPTPSGITEDAAQQYCEGPIENSQVKLGCVGFVDTSKAAIIESCELDIQITDNPEASVAGVLERFRQACIRNVLEADTRTVEEAEQTYDEEQSQNKTDEAANELPPTALLSPQTAALFDTVVRFACPGQPECSGKGTCTNGACTCDEGLVGDDCSSNADTVPAITGQRYGDVCDVRSTQTCSRTSMFVSDMIYSASFACKVVSITETYYTTAQLVSAAEVQCRLPISPLDVESRSPSYDWTVSVSNNNVTFSNEVRLFVYDSRCLDCDTAIKSCQPKADSCEIDGKCHSTGEVSDSDSCVKCDPQRNTAAWTRDDNLPDCGATTSATITTAKPRVPTKPATNNNNNNNKKVTKKKKVPTATLR